MDRTTRIDDPLDQTRRMDARAPAEGAVRVITLPRKTQVNLGLAAVAGALAVLVVLAAHDRLEAGSAHATFAPSLAPPTQSATPSEEPDDAPPRAKGKGHD